MFFSTLLLTDWIDFVFRNFLIHSGEHSNRKEQSNDCYSNEKSNGKNGKKREREKKKESTKRRLTLISELGWSMKTISLSSPSSNTLTVFSPNSSSKQILHSTKGRTAEKKKKKRTQS